MISIIIPTYNEAENIQIIVERIRKLVNCEIIIVDDNSPDRTYTIAQKISKQYSNITAIKREEEKDLSTAVIQGFKHAKGDIIGVIDADLSHPPELILKLIKYLDRNDIAIASRLVSGGAVEKWPIQRELISKIATLLAKPLTKVKDPLSGFFFFKKRVIRGIKLNPIGYKILLEILVKANYQSYKEIPYTFRNRNVGKSKINTKVLLKYVLHLLRLYKYKLLRSGN